MQLNKMDVSNKFGFVLSLLFCVALGNDPYCMRKDIIEGMTGIIESHKMYGVEDYPPNAVCKHEIRVAADKDIVFEVNELDLEPSNQCLFDYVEIRSVDGTEVERFCGRDVPGYPIVIHTSNAFVEFASDSAGVGKGFQISWQAQKSVRRAVQLKDGNGLACGLAPPRLTDAADRHRIIGGKTVGAGQWPWLASLWHESKFMCGASVLNHEWLITAAHCFRGSPPEDKAWTVVVGDFNLEWEDGLERRLSVVEIIVHPEFESRQPFDFDFALVKLEAPVEFSYAVHPICLPFGVHEMPLQQTRKMRMAPWTASSLAKNERRFERNRHGSSDINNDLLPSARRNLLASTKIMTKSLVGDYDQRLICFVAGWGKTEDQAVSPTIRDLMVPILSVDFCNETRAYGGHLTDSMLCAGNLDGGHDACQGDSGGPLVCRRATDDFWTLLGVVSFGKGCAELGTPGIYSRVSSVEEWIKKYTTK